MKRKLMKHLVAWRNGAGRKPLILQGARQVGKTYLLKQFGAEQFEQVAYVNCELELGVEAIFDESLRPARILERLSALLGMSIVPGKTLLILDEVQCCKRALTALKYFYEEAPEYAVVTAGSLLGVAVRPGDSAFPVGKVETLTLGPMDFEEFLEAVGEERLVPYIREGMTGNRPLAGIFHESLLRLLRHYLIVGGMPEAVLRRAEAERLDWEGKHSDWEGIRGIQEGLLRSTLVDMTRYAAAAESVRIQECYRSLPGQLAKPNHKFQYSTVRHGGTARRFEFALDWLVQAGLVTLCPRIRSGERPLRITADAAFFKAYHMDVGLFGAMARFSPFDLLGGDVGRALGGLVETYAAQALVAGGHELFYWASDNMAEVDFLFDPPQGVPVVVEVKSGTSVQSKSLAVFQKRYPATEAIRLSERNFGTVGQTRSVPLYAAFLL